MSNVTPQQLLDLTDDFNRTLRDAFDFGDYDISVFVCGVDPPGLQQLLVVVEHNDGTEEMAGPITDDSAKHHLANRKRHRDGERKAETGRE